MKGGGPQVLLDAWIMKRRIFLMVVIVPSNSLFFVAGNLSFDCYKNS